MGLVGLYTGMGLVGLYTGMGLVGLVGACPLQYSSSCLLPETLSYTLLSIAPCSICRAPDRTWKLSVSFSFTFWNISSWLLDLKKLLTALVWENFIISVLASSREVQSSLKAFSTVAEIWPGPLCLMVRTSSCRALTLCATRWQRSLLAFTFSAAL